MVRATVGARPGGRVGGTTGASSTGGVTLISASGEPHPLETGRSGRPGQGGCRSGGAAPRCAGWGKAGRGKGTWGGAWDR
ncbi:hypothetical protein E2C01_097879 [Portunus trituberculatus]|uniref:Uncharacterized protein n=1 Tax=Portunus trituberculatus TaxID=210409 RepID=A0A5B7K1I1_PORTR|nr:hypothetical protein [Portunus trituberculatus]